MKPVFLNATYAMEIMSLVSWLSMEFERGSLKGTDTLSPGCLFFALCVFIAHPGGL